MNKKFSYTLKIYYEDTDAGGVVYHSNYLKYLERARSEAIYTLDLSNKLLYQKYGIFILVKSCNIDYIKPAFFEDKIEVISKVISFSKTSFKMDQKIYRKKQILTSAIIHLVVVNKKSKPTKIPDVLRKALELKKFKQD
mgnify:CR=1 FL=1